MAVAVAESYLEFWPRPSTSLVGAIRLQSSSVLSFSRMGSWRMMPEMDGSWLAVEILVAISSEDLAQ